MWAIYPEMEFAVKGVDVLSVLALDGRIAVDPVAREPVGVHLMAGYLRRRWRRASAIFWVVVGLGECVQADDSIRPGFSAAFPNGVASGEVTATSVVLWARAMRPGLVTFSYSTQTQGFPRVGVAAAAAVVVVVVDANQPAKVR